MKTEDFFYFHFRQIEHKSAYNKLLLCSCVCEKVIYQTINNFFARSFVNILFLSPIPSVIQAQYEQFNDEPAECSA